MTLGLKRGTVRLCAHDPAWETLAAETIKTLYALLGDAAADIQHVGSTSVKSIMAKPIIDIAVATNDFDFVLSKKDELEKAGFYYRHHADLREQLLFACGNYYTGTGDLQTHFIHVVKTGSKDWHDYINFRDYLNAHPAAAKAYEEVKFRLAAAMPTDEGRAFYLAGKQPFISRTLASALAWSYLGKNISIVIDRPKGYVHEKDAYTLVYPLNYGFIPGVKGGDGEDLDVYLLGVPTPVREADCRVIGVVYRKNDLEDKLIAAPAGMRFTLEEMQAAVAFQERWYDTEIESLFTE